LFYGFKGNYDDEFHKYLKEKLGDSFYMEEDIEDLTQSEIITQHQTSKFKMKVKI